jgi:hypothetical protein
MTYKENNEIGLWDEVIIPNEGIIFDDIERKGIVIQLFYTNDIIDGIVKNAKVLYADKHLVTERVEKLEKTGKSYPGLANIFEQLNKTESEE